MVKYFSYLLTCVNISYTLVSNLILKIMRNQLETKQLLGYVVGIKYNSEGNIIDWLFGRSGDLEGNGGKNPAKVFKNEKAAERFATNKRKSYSELVYTRPYYMWGFSN